MNVGQRKFLSMSNNVAPFLSFGKVPQYQRTTSIYCWAMLFQICLEKEMLAELSVRCQGWRQEFSDGGLKYGFQGAINAKNLQKIAFHLPMGGLACSDGGGL